MSFSAAYKQDKLSFALQRVELQTEEAMLFQRQTNDKILLIKVLRYVPYVFIYLGVKTKEKDIS